MSESEASEPTKIKARDQLLGRFEDLTSKVEAALAHDDVDEVASLLSYRAQALAALIEAATESPLPDETVDRLQARDVALNELLQQGRSHLDETARESRTKGRAARLYAKNSK